MQVPFTSNLNSKYFCTRNIKQVVQGHPDGNYMQAVCFIIVLEMRVQMALLPHNINELINYKKKHSEESTGCESLPMYIINWGFLE